MSCILDLKFSWHSWELFELPLATIVLIFFSLLLSPTFFIFFPSKEIAINESLETQNSKKNSGLLYQATITHQRWFLYTTAGGAQKFLYSWCIRRGCDDF